jgi:hypothetical protein
VHLLEAERRLLQVEEVEVVEEVRAAALTAEQ